ncbi:MAG: UDP-N-acetylmuramoyl-L-alanyl-D-glutamate--2,6-diaminopimelate ligase [Brevinematales bacterium]|nr:UDP-N-acetylmuramoyl-L-alanyl-D-glutamate--2,6-diaminopimelate ligase [Brevinematales bacterium]
MRLHHILRNIAQPDDLPADTEISALENDSRGAGPDTLFIAASGYTDKSRDFIPDAYSRGCRIFVVDSEFAPGLRAEFPAADFIPVADIRHALAYSAKNFHGDPTARMRLIGITGTNGKTTTAFTAYSILRKLGIRAGLIGTIEYRINDRIVPATNTTPDILALNRLFAEMAAEGVEYIIMEVSSHSLALGRVLGLEFDTMAFTNFTQDHLDFHGTMENYLNEKLKIFDLLYTSVKTDKTALINLDIPEFPRIRAYSGTRGGYEFKTYSIHDARADYYSRIIDLNPRYTRFELNGVPLETGMIGDPNVYNFTLASAILMEHGFALGSFSGLLRTIHTRGRMERVHTEGGFNIFIDYAHSPDGLINLLQTMRKVVPAGGRVITLFGAGGDRDKTKRPLMGQAASDYSDLVIVTSDNPRTEDPDAIIEDILPGVTRAHEVIPGRREAIRHAIDIARPKDIIVLAGKGHEDYQILGKIKHHFSDREEAENYLTEKGLA